MRKFFTLTKVLIKNARNPIFTGKKRKIKGVFFTLLIAMAFFPIMLQIGLFASKLLRTLSPLGQEGVVLAFGFSMTSLLIFVFGILSVMAVYYFSQDVETLLALPLRSYEILTAKFLSTLIYEYVAESLFLVPVFVAFGIHTHVDFAFILSSLVVFLALPVIPLVMTSVLVMVVMLFTDITKNRDRFGKIAGTLLMILVLAMNYFLQKNAAGSANPEKVTKMLMEGKSIWMLVVNRLFPACQIAVSAVLQNGTADGFLSLFLFLAVNAGAIVCLIILGEKLYLRGVHGRPERISGKPFHAPADLSKSIAAGSAFRTYLMKDLRILFRDPIFFMNCILMNFLWPVFVVFFTIASPNADFGKLAAFLKQNSGSGVLQAAALGLGMVLTSMNAIASSAISREGKHLSVAKYLPVSYQKQISAKAGASAVMGGIGCLMMLLVAVLVYRVPISLMPSFLVLILVAIAFSAFTGVLIDLYYPKLTWDNAYKAVKQNINVLIHMAVCALVAGLTIWTVILMQWTAQEAFRNLMVVFTLTDVVLYRFLMTRGARIFNDIEV
jgi:ABC-2 type transport system permease protein